MHRDPNILRERLFEDLISADAGKAVGDETHVVVLRAGVPMRRDEGQAGAECQPHGADGPGIGDREAAEPSKHASHDLPVVWRATSPSGLVELGEANADQQAGFPVASL